MFGWAYIGYGGIAATTAKQLQNSNNTIVTVWGRNYEKACSFAHIYGGKACKSLEEAVLDEKVQGVYIGTTNDTHATFIKKCIDLGKPVLCEKPFTMHSSSTKEILEYAAQKKVYVSEAMWTWHNVVALTVKDWIAQGKIGKVISVKAKYAFPLYFGKPKTGRLVDLAMGGGALVDIGVYPLRYIYELFGKPKAIQCNGELYNGVDRKEEVTLHYEGFDANLYIAMDRYRGELMEIKGTEGTIRIPFFHCATKATLKGKKKITLKGTSSNRLYTVQFDHVAQDILQNKLQSDYVPHSSTLATAEIMEECLRQMKINYPDEK